MLQFSDRYSLYVRPLDILFYILQCELVAVVLEAELIDTEAHHKFCLRRCSLFLPFILFHFLLFDIFVFLFLVIISSSIVFLFELIVCMNPISPTPSYCHINIIDCMHDLHLTLQYSVVKQMLHVDG
eukprot:375040_1